MQFIITLYLKADLCSANLVSVTNMIGAFEKIFGLRESASKYS